MQNDEDEDEDEDGQAEPRGPGEPSTSGRETGASPVSNGASYQYLIDPIHWPGGSQVSLMASGAIHLKQWKHVYMPQPSVRFCKGVSAWMLT